MLTTDAKALPPSSPLGGSQPRDYGSRRRLLFNHLAKAGGKYAVKVIQELVPREYLTVKIEQQQSFESDRENHFVVANFVSSATTRPRERSSSDTSSDRACSSIARFGAR